MSFISLNEKNIKEEHICCAFSDNKCTQSYEAKKTWLSSQFTEGFKFLRLDARAKVFMETVPCKKAWVPIDANDYLFMGCFWVSGKYKGQGYAKALLAEAIKRCEIECFDGIVTVVGKKKFHFMSETKWLIRQGFEVVEETKDGFVLLSLKLKEDSKESKFNKSVYENNITKNGCVVYYSNRCPYSEYHVLTSLKQTCEIRNIPLEINKIESLKQAKKSPTPATIFSLYLNGKFITTDISVCMDSLFDKIVNKIALNTK
jgi:GNAT superfamily N-acetyltransferase